MKIGLIDVDGKKNFPNIALMKLSTFHKRKGDSVSWAIPLLSYDRVYMSKVFSTSSEYNSIIKADEIIKGGTGYDLQTRLSDEIEHLCPDYKLYPQFFDMAYGFLSRGCPRNCAFCTVSKKEGLISHKVADLSEFYRGQKYIKLLDPNITACKDRLELFDQLIESKAYVDITQGLDIRLMNEELAERLKHMRIKMVHFAWDQKGQEKTIIKNLKMAKEVGELQAWNSKVYVLINFDTDRDYDFYRIYKIRELGFDPYVMIYDLAPPDPEAKKIARWVNNKYVFNRVHKFEDYNTSDRANEIIDERQVKLKSII